MLLIRKTIVLPLLSSQKYLALTFSNSIVKILDSTLTLFKSSNKDASTSAAVEYIATLCLLEKYLCRCCWYWKVCYSRQLSVSCYQQLSAAIFYRALFSKTLQHFSQWCECLVTLIQFHLTNTFKFNKNTSVTSKYMAQLSLQLTLNVFNLLMHCSI